MVESIIRQTLVNQSMIILTNMTIVSLVVLRFYCAIAVQVILIFYLYIALKLCMRWLQVA